MEYVLPAQEQDLLTQVECFLQRSINQFQKEVGMFRQYFKQEEVKKDQPKELPKEASSGTGFGIKKTNELDQTGGEGSEGGDKRKGHDFTGIARHW